MQRRVGWLAVLLALALFAAACGGGDQGSGDDPTEDVTEQDTEEPTEEESEEPTEEESDEPTEEETEEPTEEPEDEETEEVAGGEAVSSVDDVDLAVVQIVAEGAFRDPEFGEYEGTGAGTGFIIDPEGLVVTNNHVVTGSASLNIFLDGAEEPVNGRVLGVSECSDLAVVDLEGEDYPYLEWYDEDIETGLDVFSAGFPLGDPEFSLTDGIVSRADYDVETTWASVESVVSHTARLNPGNSGGPLVTEDGLVVGVNYAGDEVTDENLAIASSEAQTVIESLREGEDVTSIGVNGLAVDDGQGNTGVWVSSVESGSPADNAQIDSGDIITQLENVTLAEDGTVADYCDILRSRTREDVLQVQVLRYDSEEVLEGQLNGDELVQSFSFAQTVEAPTAPPAGGGGGNSEAAYSGYRPITDDTGAIVVEVPNEWTEVDGRPATDSAGRALADVIAASSVDGFLMAWETPGMRFSASSEVAQQANEVTLLDQRVAAFSEACTYQGRQPYSDALYSGQYDLYTDCGGVGAQYLIVGAVPADRSFVIRVEVQVNSERDLEALDRILNTFQVVGDV